MKTAVIYKTKTNTSKKCAELLRGMIGTEEVDVINLAEQKPDLALYDTVVIGASVRAGMIGSKMKRYLKRHVAELAKKQLYLYLCCVSTDDVETYLQKNIPAELLKHASAAMRFGALVCPEEASGLSRKMMESMKKSYAEKGIPEPCINETAIREMAEMITRLG
ncbi:MAG: flavodoxin domain-containing protein [Anaerofustis sp.]